MIGLLLVALASTPLGHQQVTNQVTLPQPPTSASFFVRSNANANQGTKINNIAITKGIDSFLLTSLQSDNASKEKKDVVTAIAIEANSIAAENGAAAKQAAEDANLIAKEASNTANFIAGFSGIAVPLIGIGYGSWRMGQMRDIDKARKDKDKTYDEEMKEKDREYDEEMKEKDREYDEEMKEKEFLRQKEYDEEMKEKEFLRQKEYDEEMKEKEFLRNLEMMKLTADDDVVMKIQTLIDQTKLEKLELSGTTNNE